MIVAFDDRWHDPADILTLGIAFLFGFSERLLDGIFDQLQTATIKANAAGSKPPGSAPPTPPGAAPPVGGESVVNVARTVGQAVAPAAPATPVAAPVTLAVAPVVAPGIGAADDAAMTLQPAVVREHYDIPLRLERTRLCCRQ